MKRFAALLMAMVLSMTSVANAEQLLGEDAPETQTAFSSADASEYVLSAGSVTPATLPEGSAFGGAAVLAGETDPVTLFLQRILIAWHNFSSELIDVSDLGFTIAEGTYIYGAAMNLYPRYFDVSPVFRYAYSGNMMTGIVPQYLCSKEENQVRLQEYDAAVFKMVEESVSEEDYSSMTDTEIALAVHDYLALHVRYSYKAVQNRENDPDAFNIYGAVVNGSAVCQGYSLAYSELLYYNNIYSAIVTSKNANHAWNVVALENGSYHVDVTFDDPGCKWSSDGDNDISGFARHDFFMLTDEELLEADASNDRSDMACEITEADRADSSHPDSALWKGALTMFYFGGGRWLRLKDYAFLGTTTANQPASCTGADFCSLNDPEGTEIYSCNTALYRGLMARLGNTLYFNAFPVGAASGEIHALDISTYEEKTVLTLPEGHIADELEEKDGEIYYLDLWYDSSEENEEDRLKYEYKKLELSGEEPPEPPADLTGDGVMDVLDAIALSKHLAGLSSIDDDVLIAAGFTPAAVSVRDAVSVCME